MTGSRRLFLRLGFVMLASTAVGCFALFPLDDYQAGTGADADGGNGLDAAQSSTSSSGGFTQDGAPVNVNQKHVFITSVLTDGDIVAAGGGGNYDALCQSLAADAGLTGKYRVWLSGAHSPLDRFFPDASPPSGVKLVDLQGRPIAASWSQLLQTGALENPIEIDETRRRVSEEELDASFGSCSGLYTPVWTNTLSDGGPGPSGISNCTEFTSNGSGNTAIVGVVTDARTQWTASCAFSCNLKAHLYCFETQ